MRSRSFSPILTQKARAECVSSENRLALKLEKRAFQRRPLPGGQEQKSKKDPVARVFELAIFTFVSTATGA